MDCSRSWFRKPFWFLNGYIDPSADQLEMRVLHIHNTAGVPGLLVRGLRGIGIEADLLISRRHPYGFPSGTPTSYPPLVHLVYAILRGRRYDLVHIHGLQHIGKCNIDLFLHKMFNEKIILHLHGTELRKNYHKRRVKLLLKTLRPILVSTHDLLKYCEAAIYLPNPIDGKMFKPMRLDRCGTLYFSRPHESERLAKETWRDLDLPSPLHIQSWKRMIPHRDMPRLLNSFECFIDQLTIPSLSKTALESLACGCKVVDWQRRFAKPEVLEQHKLQNVIANLLRFYNRSIDKRVC